MGPLLHAVHCWSLFYFWAGVIVVDASFQGKNIFVLFIVGVCFIVGPGYFRYWFLLVRKVHFCVGLNVGVCFIVTFTRKTHFHELRNCLNSSLTSDIRFGILKVYVN